MTVVHIFYNLKNKKTKENQRNLRNINNQNIGIEIYDITNHYLNYLVLNECVSIGEFITSISEVYVPLAQNNNKC